VSPFFLSKGIKEESLVPCYFLFGEEDFLADEFIQELKETFVSPGNQEYGIEKFSLEDTSWAAIIDSARNMPIFLSPWRIIAVNIQEGNAEEPEHNDKSSIKDYLASPPAKTILVVVYRGKLKRNEPLLSFFSSFSRDQVCVKEMAPLKGHKLYSWIDQKIRAENKNISKEAIFRLVEIRENDLRTLDNELEKLVSFVGEKKVIELDDVNQVSGWAKTFMEYELANCLEKADYKQCLLVLNNLFEEGVRPEYILSIVANFFRDIFLAKLRLMEKHIDRREIFKEVKPRITEKMGFFYQSKLRDFFYIVERMSIKNLNKILEELKKIDYEVKTTGASCQVLLERFLFEYCSGWKQKSFTWKERRL